MLSAAPQTVLVSVKDLTSVNESDKPMKSTRPWTLRLGVLVVLCNLVASPVAIQPAFADHEPPGSSQPGHPSNPGQPGTPESENNEISLTRNADSALELPARLTQNIYRYVEREVTEQVQVPYQVTIPYQDHETYYELEQRCGYVNRPVCHTTNRCSTHNTQEKVCRPVRKCRPSPHGEVCFDHNECRVVSRPVQRCEPVRVCQDRTEHVCHTERVPRTRVVTRYRVETHYRTETRTRVVTDRVFDRQWSVDSLIVLPAESRLQGSEQETILVRLSGTESQPQIEVSVDSPIFNYQVSNQVRKGQVLVTTLRLVAKYQPHELAEQTLIGATLTPSSDGTARVTFEDRGLVARTTTRYNISVVDKDTGKTVIETQQEGSFGNRQVTILIPGGVVQAHDHLIRIGVVREGAVIAGPVAFTKEVHLVGQLDPAPYVDPNGVREFAIEGRETSARLTFLDVSPADSKVETKYTIRFKRKFAGFLWNVTMAEATLNRKDLTVESDGRSAIGLDRVPELSERELKRFFDGGDKVYLEVDVVRTSPRLAAKSPVRFTKEAKLKIRK